MSAAASAAAAAASCLGLGHDSSGRSTPGRSLRHMLMMTAIAAIAKMLLLIDLQVKYVNNMQYVNNMCFHYWTIVWTRVENENSRGHCLDHTTSHIRYGNISS
jgi:hypothetical protein